MTDVPRRRGRPGPGENRATRDAIMSAASRQFAELGFDRTSMRGVAVEAGVDPALITHYFGGKAALFVETVRLPVDATRVHARILDGAPEGVGERLAGLVLDVMESPAGRRPLVGMVRAATSHPDAARLVRERLAHELVGPVAAGLGSDEPELRTALVMSQIVGLTMARYVVGLEPLASVDRARIVAAVAPTLQRYLTGPLGEADLGRSPDAGRGRRSSA